ncbi:hypothetical protein J6590_088896 [Homalodisca vitripennis]|nr:hypothetical protein J6590_088896 [Homalodisca vitripennis]
MLSWISAPREGKYPPAQRRRRQRPSRGCWAVDLRNNHDSHHAETSLRFRCTTCQSLHRRWNGVASHYARCRGPPMTVPAAETYAFSCGRRFSTQTPHPPKRPTPAPEPHQPELAARPPEPPEPAPGPTAKRHLPPGTLLDASPEPPSKRLQPVDLPRAVPPTGGQREEATYTWDSIRAAGDVSIWASSKEEALAQPSRHGEPEDPPGSPPDGPPGPPGSPRRREDPEAENEGRDALDWERILAHINAIQPLCPIGNQLRTPAARVGSIHEEDNPETAA